MHLYAGEEAVATGVCMNLSDADFVASTHRGHGHCIAKGVDVNGMMAELYGRATGVCKGKGGSMHIADLDQRHARARTASLVAGIPLATGAGLSAQAFARARATWLGRVLRRRRERIRAQFHESLNMAANWKLPVRLRGREQRLRRVHADGVRRPGQGHRGSGNARTAMKSLTSPTGWTTSTSTRRAGEALERAAAKR